MSHRLATCDTFSDTQEFFFLLFCSRNAKNYATPMRHSSILQNITLEHGDMATRRRSTGNRVAADAVGHATAWFAVLERARLDDDYRRAEQATRELERLGVRVTFSAATPTPACPTDDDPHEVKVKK